MLTTGMLQVNRIKIGEECKIKIFGMTRVYINFSVVSQMDNYTVSVTDALKQFTRSRGYQTFFMLNSASDSV